MTFPFISVRAHLLIVECLKARIAELVAERDFYRGRVFGPEAGVVSLLEPPSRRSSEIQEAPIDATWTEDDRDLFKSWSWGNVRDGEDPLQKWAEKYGSTAPLVALTV